MKRSSSLRKNLLKILDRHVPGLTTFIDPTKYITLPKDEEKFANLMINVIESFAKPKPKARKGVKRHHFPKRTRMLTLISQLYRCNRCKNKLEEVDFHHIDGNRANNHISNCEALCPGCHAKLTRSMRR